MNRLTLNGLVILWMAWAPVASAEALLLISVDGLHPQYVLEADRLGLDIPNLRRYLTDGSFARGVVGVVPTVTYPSHTTMLTGVSPATHGIIANTPFDPTGANRDGWYWYAEDIRSPTLWQAASAAGLSTAAVNWPVTVGDASIDYLLPEFWRASTADDYKLLKALSRPAGILESLEGAAGPFADGNMDTVAADESRTAHAKALLERYAPEFTAVHLIALDGEEHRLGPYTPDVHATLEAIDGMIGQLENAMLTAHPQAVLAVVSDHGFIATHTAVNLRSAFVDAGLITLHPQPPNTVPAVADWSVQLWSAGASAAVVLREAGDRDMLTRVTRLLESLQADPANGIARIIAAQDVAERGGFPGAALFVEFAPGFYLGAGLRGPLTEPATSKGTHGYWPDRPEMHAAFFIRGTGIARGRDLGVVDMRALAPTLARALGIGFTGGDLPALDGFTD
ncbi:MAG: hypothetical protein RLZZ385_834 [Pseudomonadota bacterium]